MTCQNATDLLCRIRAMSVFRPLLDTRPLRHLCALLGGMEQISCAVDAYGAFVHALADDGCSLSSFLLREVCASENLYIRTVAAGKSVPPCVTENVREELSLFSCLSRLTPEELRPEGYRGYWPRFSNTPTDFCAVYADRVENIGRYGYGIFATAGMFCLRGEEIVPVASADPVCKDSFIGYEAQRERLWANTEALVAGRPAANALLCGDAGTGKSSSVKACANAFFHKGVRLIELRKDQLLSLASVMGRIADNPLKFILFIDDLSFTKNDDSFSMLKAALEGSASAKAQNAVIYATSNRRHIVKESFSDRANDDVHHSDTVQELLSLSDRFGLTIYFERPAKKLYLEIVHALCARYGIIRPQEEIDVQAEAFALMRGSRSARAAEQFVRSLL